jgi:hypothetical protein
MDTTPKPQKKVEYRVPNEGIFTAYCNNVQMATTSFDVRVIFGEIADVIDDKVIVDQKVRVTMTWLEAKILADFLQANIKVHEEINGPLELPKAADKVVVPDTFQVISK